MLVKHPEELELELLHSGEPWETTLKIIVKIMYVDGISFRTGE